MDIIVDTNIFLAVVLEEPEKKHIIQVTPDANLISPEVLPFEIGNALSAMIKRKTLTENEALEAEKKTHAIPVRLVAVDIHQSLKLAIKFNIYAYDAYFFQCAKRMKQVAKELNIKILE